MIGRILAVSVGALALLGPARAFGDQASDLSRAESLFRSGKLIRDAGFYADACPLFAQSSRLARGVGVLLYLGDCDEHEGRTASAWTAFRDAESLARQRDDSRAEIAHTRADALAGQLSRLTIVVPKGSSEAPRSPSTGPSSRRMRGTPRWRSIQEITRSRWSPQAGRRASSRPTSPRPGRAKPAWSSPSPWPPRRPQATLHPPAPHPAIPRPRPDTRARPLMPPPPAAGLASASSRRARSESPWAHPSSSISPGRRAPRRVARRPTAHRGRSGLPSSRSQREGRRSSPAWPSPCRRPPGAASGGPRRPCGWRAVVGRWCAPDSDGTTREEARRRHRPSTQATPAAKPQDDAPPAPRPTAHPYVGTGSTVTAEEDVPTSAFGFLPAWMSAARTGSSASSASSAAFNEASS